MMKMKSGNIFIPALLLCVAGTIGCSRIEQPQSGRNFANAKVFYAETPSSSSSSKTYVDTEGSIYWHEGENISVFRSTVNEKYQFQGKEGEIVNEFRKVGGGATGALLSKNYAVYPYSESISSDEEGIFAVILPETQHYAENSFGNEAAMMVAVSKDVNDDIFYFRNVCGYLVLKIYGGDAIRSIKLTGNSGEKLSGSATLKASYGSAPQIEMSQDAGTQIVLDCGEDGVQTEVESDKYTTFWMAVPPVTFENGFNVEVTTVNGTKMSQTTIEKKTLTQNTVTRMALFECSEDYYHEFTSFSLSDGTNTYPAFDISNDYVNIMVPNGADLSNLTASFTYKGASVKIGDEPQTSGVGAHDFSDFAHPLQYIVTGDKGIGQTYTIRLFDLPVVFINTDDSTPVTSKIDYVGCTIKILDCDTVTIYDGNIKGRGNSTWGCPKKPYNIKFSSSQKILGMPKHKKWCLLANYMDRTLMRNDICQEIGRLSDNLDWCPHGQYIDLFLNGEHKGLYWLCEKIEVDGNRVDIDKDKGYLFEYDSFNDDDYKMPSPYLSNKYSYLEYVKLKSPVEEAAEDPDSLIMKGLIGYITDFEDVLSGKVDGNYYDYIDLPSFVDYMIVEDISGNGDSGKNSTYAHKDVDGKICMGPIWDFDYFVFSNNVSFPGRSSFYYPELLEKEEFKYWVKKSWNIYKIKLESSYIPNYVETLYKRISRSAERDRIIWPNSGGSSGGDANLSIKEAKDRLIDIYTAKVFKEDTWISSLTVNFDGHSGNSEDYSDQEDKSGELNIGF